MVMILCEQRGAWNFLVLAIGSVDLNKINSLEWLADHNIFPQEIFNVPYIKNFLLRYLVDYN